MTDTVCTSSVNTNLLLQILRQPYRRHRPESNLCNSLIAVIEDITRIDRAEVIWIIAWQDLFLDRLISRQDFGFIVAGVVARVRYASDMLAWSVRRGERFALQRSMQQGLPYGRGYASEHTMGMSAYSHVLMEGHDRFFVLYQLSTCHSITVCTGRIIGIHSLFARSLCTHAAAVEESIMRGRLISRSTMRLVQDHNLLITTINSLRLHRSSLRGHPLRSMQNEGVVLFLSVSKSW